MLETVDGRRSWFHPLHQSEFCGRMCLRRILICSASMILVCGSGVGYANEPNLLFADMVVTTGERAVLRSSTETESALSNAFHDAQPSRPQHSARDVLGNFNQLVAVAIVTLADHRRSEIRVPLRSGGSVDIYTEEIVVAGTVLALSPLARTVLGSAPVIGVRRLRLNTPATAERIEAEALEAGIKLGRIARERANLMGRRFGQASIRRGLLGSTRIDAGQKQGIRIGTTVSVQDGSGAIECRAIEAKSSEASLDCERPVPSNSIGIFLRSVGDADARYQVTEVLITSKKALEALGGSTAEDQTMISFTASDAISQNGLTVLPPADNYGERATREGIQRFGAHFGLAESEIETFSLKFPPADVQIKLVVDGYNTAIVGESFSRRVRAHKAWVTATDNLGRTAEGVGVLTVETIADWQDDEPQAADARQALREAARCATSRLLQIEEFSCSE